MEVSLRHAIVAFLMMLVIVMLQYLLHIDSTLTALVSALAGFVAGFFAMKLVQKEKKE